MQTGRWLDLLVIALYIAAMAAVGLRFSRRQKSTEDYFLAKRSVPAWAMGFSMVATLISSIAFVAYPGFAYAKDWSNLTPGFMVLITLGLAGRVIIPFYRQEVGMSAYEYFERRFGRPARVYASLMFLLAHFSKMGFVFYLTGLTIGGIAGWNVDYVIAGVCVAMLFYAMIGGIEAVIWTDVIQVFVCWAGVIVSLGYLLFLPPGGPSAVFALAAANGKFSLGAPVLDFTKPTLPVLIIYGFFWYMQRYLADQTVVQRYLVAKTDKAALRGVALGACLTLPVWTVFMLLGTCTWAFYKLTAEKLPAYITKADQIFPHFIATHLPPGVAGLFMASLIGAAMTMLASDLNSLASVAIADLYTAAKPQSTDRQRLVAAKAMVAIAGILAAGTGIGLAHTTGSALTMWFAASAIFSGGLCGLALLAFLSRRANRYGVYVGIAASTACTVWAVLTKGAKPLVNLGAWNFPWDDLMIGAAGHMVMIATAYAASWMFTAPPAEVNRTIWDWLDRAARDHAGSA